MTEITVKANYSIRCGELLLNLVIVRAENIVAVDDCQIGILAGGMDCSLELVGGILNLE